MQCYWLWRAVDLQMEEREQTLMRLSSEVALAINGYDHDMLHSRPADLAKIPTVTFERRIDSVLSGQGIDPPTQFAIFQDSSEGIFYSNAPERKAELMASDIRSCLSCIVSFSVAPSLEKQEEESDSSYYARLENASTFQYFSPVDKSDRPPGQVLWLALHQSGGVSTAIRSLLGLFVVNLLLLAVLIFLFRYLVRSWSRHKHISKAKEDFFNQMTHEFKTPLSSIRLASTVLRQSKDPEKNANFHRIIEEECKSLESRVDKLLQLSLMDSKGLDLEMEELDLDALLLEVPRRMQMLIDRCGADLVLNLAEGGAKVLGDRDHLSSSICNLVENSLKYGPQGVRVCLETRLLKKGVEVVVRDNGPGIGAADQAKVFDHFFRAGEEDQYKGHGFGVGLTYVRSVVEAHGGRVYLNPAYQQGCEFIIELP